MSLHFGTLDILSRCSSAVALLWCNRRISSGKARKCSVHLILLHEPDHFVVTSKLVSVR